MASQSGSSLDKALALLFAFAGPDDQRVFTVSGLAEQQGMDKAQVSRSLATFARYGLVERLDNRRGYQLGWSVMHLAGRSLTAQTMSTVYPALSALATVSEETVHFSVRDGSRAVALASFEPDRRLFVAVRTGRPEPLLGSAVGYALLSRSDPQELGALRQTAARRAGRGAPTWQEHLERVRAVREAGISVVSDERGESVTTAAVPIFDVGNYRGRVHAAIGLSAPDQRFADASGPCVDRLREIADEANRFLHGKDDGR